MFSSYSRFNNYISFQHDTLSYYKASPQPDGTNFPINVHSHKLQIAPNLHLLGLGGSVPSFQEGRLLWEGFPFDTDEKFGEALAGLLDPVLQEEVGTESSPGDRDSYIIMTHNGPNNSSKFMGLPWNLLRQAVVNTEAVSVSKCSLKI